jgi:hypothetical protein
MTELARPPAVVIRLDLEGGPRVFLDCSHEGDVLRLRDWIAANRPRLLDRVGFELSRFVGDPEIEAPTAEAGSVIVQRGTTIAEVAERAAAGDGQAREWILWAARNLRDAATEDERWSALVIFLNGRPELDDRLRPLLVAELDQDLESWGGGP